MKILDFGLAQVKEPVEEEADTATLTPAGTAAGTVMGTMGYMSRNSFGANRQTPDPTSSPRVHSLYEMLSGRTAFLRNSTARPQQPSSRRSRSALFTGSVLPADVERSIHRLLSRRARMPVTSHRLTWHSPQSILNRPRSAVATHITALSARRWAVAAISIAVIAALALILGRSVFDRPATETENPTIRSIAVLPLENLSGDPEQEYFSDGMTDALITVLTKIEALKVISRKSTMLYKETNKPLPEIARELNVDAVVAGSVLRAGDRVRITAQLIHAETDQHLWAESYERDMQDILTLQGDVAKAIVGEIRIAMTPEEEARISRSGRVNPEAHEAISGVVTYLNKHTPADLRRAIDYFQQAIDTDPDFALPYAIWPFLCSGWRGNWPIVSVAGAKRKAKTMANKALEIDQNFRSALFVRPRVDRRVELVCC